MAADLRGHFLRTKKKLSLRRDLQARLRPPQIVLGAIVVKLRIVALQELLGALFRLLCSRYVDFLGTLDGFGKDRDFVLEHLGKSPCHRKGLGCAACPVSDDTHSQLGNQWSMSRQDSQISI